jgi:hypothetical protein
MRLRAAKIVFSATLGPYLDGNRNSGMGSSGSRNFVRGRLLRFGGGFIDQHDGDVVLDCIDPVALLALQALRILAVLERLFAGRTDQDFQQFFGNHDLCIVRHGVGRSDELAVFSPRRRRGRENRDIDQFPRVSVPPW